MKSNPVKRRLQSGEIQAGVFLISTDPQLVGVTAAAGFDYVMSDLEHGALSLRELEGVVRSADCAGCVPLTRVAGSEKRDILAVLETGVRGIMVPVVETAEQARRIVQISRYTPHGSRGAFYLSYGSEYCGISPEQHYRTANEELLIICQVETAAGVENAAEIAAVEGVDAVLIGPGDLTSSLGIPFQFEHEMMWQAIRRVFSAVLQAGKIAGIMPVTADYASRCAELGARLMLWGPDMLMYRRACRADVEELQQALNWSPRPATG